MSNINFFNVVSQNNINGYIIKSGSYYLKSGIYNNTTMKFESGIDDESITGDFYTAVSQNNGATWEYNIGFTGSHSALSNLDFNTCGHTGFAGIDTTNTFSEINTFSNAIHTDRVQSINTNLYMHGTNGVYIGRTGQVEDNSTLYVSSNIEARADMDMTNHFIHNVLNPVENNDAVNLQTLNTAISAIFPEVYKTMVNGTDTAGYLETKVLSGNGIDITINTEDITINSNIQNTVAGGVNLFKNGYTAKQLTSSDYIKFEESDDAIQLLFDYNNFSVNTIWQDSVLDFKDITTVVTDSFVGGERYINYEKGEDVFGFDADGSTKLTAYTNPIIDYKDCIIEFELINRELGSAEQEIFRPHKNKFNQQITILIKSNGNLVVWVDALGANDGIVFPEVSFSKNELTNFKVVFSESQTGFPQGEIFLNEVSKGIGVAPNQIPNEPLYGNNPYPFFNLNNLGFFTGIIANFKISNNAGIQFEETFNNETKGTVIGTEQYALIETPEIGDNNIYTWDEKALDWFVTDVRNGFATWVNDEDLSDDKGYWSFNGSTWVRFGGSLAHNYLSGMNGGDGSIYYHLSDSERLNLVTGTNTTLHYHTALRDSNSDTIAYAEAGIFYVNNEMTLNGVESSVRFKDTTTGNDVIVSNIDSKFTVDSAVKANGFDFNNNKGVNVANPTEALDVVNLQTLEASIGTKIVKISDSVSFANSKIIDTINFTTNVNVKLLYFITDDAGNNISGEICVVCDTINIDSNDYGILKLGDELMLNEYYITFNNTGTELEVILNNDNATNNIGIVVIKIDVFVG